MFKFNTENDCKVWTASDDNVEVIFENSTNDRRIVKWNGYYSIMLNTDCFGWVFVLDKNNTGGTLMPKQFETFEEAMAL